MMKNNQYQNIIESMHDGVIFADLNDFLQYANRQFYSMTGYQPAELSGRHAFEKLLTPEGKKLVLQKSKLRKKGVTDQYELQMRKKSGEFFWAAVTGTPVKDEKGKIIGTLATINDITARKKEQLLKEISQNIFEKANRRFIDIEMLSRDVFLELLRVIPVHSFYIALYDRKNNSLRFPFVMDDRNKYISGYERKFDKGLTEYGIKKGKSLLLTDKQIRNIKGINYKKFLKPLPKCWLGVPLKAEGKIVGIISIHSYQHRNAYGKNEMQLLEFVSSQLANIIERNNYQEEIHAQEKYFRTLIEHSSDITAILGKDGTFRYVSKPVEKILGYKQSELTGKTFLQLVHKDEKDLAVDKFLKRLENPGEGKLMLWRIKHKDGSYRKMEIFSNSLVNTPPVNGVVLNAKDVTERVKFESEMKVSYDILSRVGSLVVVCDKQGNFTYISSSSFRILGYMPEELLGNKWWGLSYTDNEGAKTIKKQITEMALIDKMQHIPQERKILTKSGQEKWILWEHSVGIDGSIIGVGHDITEMKKAEEQIKLATNELNMFVYKSSHDLKGPLASIMGITNYAREEKKINEAGLSYMNLIEESAKRLDSILNDLLAVCHMKQNSLLKEKIHLPKLVNEVVRSLRHNPEYSNVQITTDFASGCQVNASEKLLSSVIQNLLENSVKYRKIGQNGAYTQIIGRTEKKFVSLTVADNGIGISESVLPKIFDMFYRGTNLSKGTGLGLYIVKNAVEKMNGTIEVSSKEGEGTKFEIILPKK